MDYNQSSSSDLAAETKPKRSRRWPWIVALIIIIIALVLVAFSYTFLRNRSTANKPCDLNSSKSKAPAEVTITESGFIPENIAVERCQQVNWTNQDKSPHQVAADPYPTHSTYPELVGPALTKDDSFSFIMEKSGTLTYHDELNPLKFKGSIIVK